MLIRRSKIPRFSSPWFYTRIKYKTFEDNMSCISLATSHKTRPRTKHLCIKLHNLPSYVVNTIISIEYIPTKDQIAEIFTKPVMYPSVHDSEVHDA